MIDRGLFVTVKDSLVEGMITFDQFQDQFELQGRFKATGNRTGEVYKMGDVLRVKIISADLDRRQIELSLVESD